jgi:hypothetical protein
MLGRCQWDGLAKPVRFFVFPGNARGGLHWGRIKYTGIDAGVIE